MHQTKTEMTSRTKTAPRARARDSAAAIYFLTFVTYPADFLVHEVHLERQLLAVHRVLAAGAHVHARPMQPPRPQMSEKGDVPRARESEGGCN